MLYLKRKIKEEENNNSHICSRFLSLIWSTATQLLCHLAVGGKERKPLAEGTRLSASPWRGFIVDRKFPLLLWKRHLLHHASSHVWLCSLCGKERNVWKRQGWGSSRQQSRHCLTVLYHGSLLGKLTEATSHPWLPPGRAHLVFLQKSALLSWKLTLKAGKDGVCDLPSWRDIPSRSMFSGTPLQYSVGKPRVSGSSSGSLIVPGKAQHSCVPEKKAGSWQ